MTLFFLRSTHCPAFSLSHSANFEAVLKTARCHHNHSPLSTAKIKMKSWIPISPVLLGGRYVMMEASGLLNPGPPHGLARR